MKRNAASVAYLILVVLVSAIWSDAQSSAGLPPFSSLGGGPFDIVNLGNLNVHFSIPIRHKAGRGIPFANGDLSYDSSQWSIGLVNGHSTWIPRSTSLATSGVYWGWVGLSNAGVAYIQYSLTTSQGTCGQFNNQQYNTWQYTNFIYYDEHSTAHYFGGSGVYIDSSNCGGYGPPTGAQPAGTQTLPAGDGSGLTLYYTINPNSISAFLTTQSGVTLNPPVATNPPGQQGSFSQTDTNGNSLNAVNGTYTDTLGQTALSVVGSAPSNTNLNYTAPSGATASYVVSYKSYTVKTFFNCGTVVEANLAAVYLVDRVTLPDSTYYQFAYEQTPNDANSNHVTGRMAQITLPTGGSISYQYTGANDGILCSGGSSDGNVWYLTRTVTPGGTWTYTRAIVGSGPVSTTTMQAPSGDQTAITFSGSSGTYETQRQAYQGTASTGTLLLTTTTSYSPNPTPPFTQVTTTLQYPNNGQTAGLQSQTVTKYDSTGSLVTETDQYGYGVGAPGGLLRKTAVVYATTLSVLLGGGLVSNITDHPASVTVTDGNGKVLSNITYAYDEYSSYPLQPTTGTPHHGSVSGSRGNATTITSTVIGTTSLTRHFAYYDTGNVYKAYDVNGAVTTYNYDTTVQGNSTKSCGNSFPTSITSPIAGLSNASTTWNCAGGIATAGTDLNGNATTTSYSDPYYWRPASVTDPTTASTSFTYTAYNPSTQALASVESKMLFNSNNSVVDRLTTVGRFGNPLYSQQHEAPSGTNSANYDSTQVLYDSFLRAYKSSMPCVSTTITFTGQNQACPSAAVTTSTFDALGRVTQTTDGGNPTPGYGKYTYNQNDVLQDIGPAPSGENDKQKQLEYDALGRLTSVCELTSQTGYSQCGQTNPYNGYMTSYVYGVNGSGNPTTTVTQGPSGSTQTRVYTYDLLGRVISEQNPENGTVTYTYDSDSAGTCSGTYNGDLVKLTDAKGNKICYQYDALHRVTSITYPTGPDSANTPTKTMVYDSATFNGTAMSNPKGRLVEAYTGASGSKTTDEFFSYSVRGELTDTYECTPHSGTNGCASVSNYYHVTAGYWANGALNTLSSNISGLPSQTYVVDGMGRTNGVNASAGQIHLVDSTGTSYDLANYKTTVKYGSGDSDVVQLDQYTGRMKSYAFNVGSQNVTGNLTWNSNGSLGTLAITNQLNSLDTQTCSYTHDDLSRISSVGCVNGSTNRWNQNFAYDAFGNISKTVPTGGTGIAFPGYSPSQGYSSSTNQLLQISGCAPPTYDSNGQMTNDCSHNYTWDAEGKMHSVDANPASCSTSGECLTYDALGRMVEKAVGSTSTQIVYGPQGNKFATMNGQTFVSAFIPLPGAQAVYTQASLSTSNKVAYYRHADHLGSSRLATTPTQTMYSSTAYAPTGEPYSQSGATDLSFTGQDQDTVSGMHDFLFRKFMPVQGRWISPDPGGLAVADPTNPQSWNRYAYVLNNPMALIDPFGLDYCNYSGSGKTPTNPNWCAEAGGTWVQTPTPTPPPKPCPPGACQANPCAGGVGACGVSLGGQTGSGGGTTGTQTETRCLVPNSLQKLGIKVQGWIAGITGRTVGLGAGGSAGAGVGKGFGLNVSISRQVVVAPDGSAGIAVSYTRQVFGVTSEGEAAVGGIQVSASTAQSVMALEGLSLDVGAQAADGLGVGADASFSSSDMTISGTVGIGEGGYGHGGSVTQTLVTPFCK